ncbi:hypothetical protein N7467_009019 [Penicillium canescens]|nr:hypothetical protein N7467_009019 [Penicillium canescens]
MKGFVGGIPIALLAVAAQAKFQEHDFVPHAGGTVIGGPSGDDSDGGFTSPYTANIKTNTQVHEYSKDDHSVHLKHKDVYLPPHFHFGPPVVEKGPQVPGMGPFEKRGAPGGTVIGGPSGNDEGQSFDMPITGIFQTEVNDYNKDDHSIAIKNKDVHPPPQFHGPPHGYHGRPAGPPSAAFNAPPSTFEKRWGPEEGGGTVMGGPGGSFHHGPAGFPHPHGGTVIGGPSGDDDGISFSKPVTGHFKTDVNEDSKDDHSVHLKHKDVYPRPPIHFGAHPPFRRAYSPSREAGGGTVIGGPSGDDDGTDYSDPTNIDVTSGVNEHHEDDHAIKGDFTHVHPPAPSHYSWADDEEGPYSYEGGPSSYEEGPSSYEAPPAPVESPVTESFPAAGSPPAHAEVPQAATEAEAPPREDHQECAAKVHEVVRTVTKTQYKTVDATPEVPKLYKLTAQTSAVSMAATPQMSAQVDPKVFSNAVPLSGSASSGVRSYASAVSMAATPQMSAQVDPKVFSNAVPLSGSASSGVRSYAPYSYASQRLMSHAASYSTVPVHVPMATPASSSYAMATPSGSMAKMMPTGVDSVSHGAKSSAVASPSEHATMFEGGAARLSGGLLSAAAGVMGVLAFIL